MSYSLTYFFSLMIFVAQLNAQVTITDQFKYIIGDTACYTTYTDVEVLPGETGSDVTWDFSDLDLADPVKTYYVYTDPGELVGLEASARDRISMNSNVAVKIYTESWVNQFIVFRHQNDDTIESTGSFYVVSPRITTKSNPQVINIFPLPIFSGFTSSFTDSVLIKDNTSDSWVFSSATDRETEVVFDGFGTVITPDSTYANCIRLKRINGNRINYNYVQNRLSNLIVNISKVEGDPTASILFGSVTSSPPTSTYIPRALANLSVYLTPANLFSITVAQGTYDYALLDNLGRQVALGSLIQSQEKMEHNLLNHAAISAGVYHLVLIDKASDLFTTTSLIVRQ